MAVAALPMAATHTGESPSAAPSAARTGVFFCLHRGPRKIAHLVRLRVLTGCGKRDFLGGILTYHFELAAPVPAGELRRVRALDLQPLEIRRRHIAGHVHTREARGVELLDACILVLARGDQVVEILIHEPIRADERLDLLHSAAARHEL